MGINAAIADLRVKLKIKVGIYGGVFVLAGGRNVSVCESGRFFLRAPCSSEGIFRM